MPASRSSDTVLLSLDASFSLSLTVCMRIEHALLGLHHQTIKNSMHTCSVRRHMLTNLQRPVQLRLQHSHFPLLSCK